MSWSYSRLSLYERCPFQYEGRYIKKVKEEKSEALLNGIAKHDLCEQYLKGDRKRIPKGVNKIAGSLRRLKSMEAVAEEWWNITEDWVEAKKKDWLIAKIDAYCFPEPNTIEVTDFKTGKVYPTHKEQHGLYATMAFCIFDVEIVISRGDYIDTGKSVTYRWTLDQLPALRADWRRRAETMMEDKELEPTPGYYCAWCPRSRLKKGDCKRG